MATRMRHRETGSEIVVPDEKRARLYAMGYSPVDEANKAPAKKAPAKKAAAKAAAK